MNRSLPSAQASTPIFVRPSITAATRSIFLHAQFIDATEYRDALRTSRDEREHGNFVQRVTEFIGGTSQPWSLSAVCTEMMPESSLPEDDTLRRDASTPICSSVRKKPMRAGLSDTPSI